MTDEDYWLELSASAFDFWHNEDDAVYDDLGNNEQSDQHLSSKALSSAAENPRQQKKK